MYRHARRAALPPQIARLPRILPLSRLNGATPTRAAACRRVSEPSSGSSAKSVRALTGPTPGTERNSSSLARQTALSLLQLLAANAPQLRDRALEDDGAELARELRVEIAQARRRRHRFLRAPAATREALGGGVEANETFFRSSHKGSR